MQGLWEKRFEKSKLKEGPEMFLFLSKTNGYFINVQSPSIRIKHLLQGVVQIKLFSC